MTTSATPRFFPEHAEPQVIGVGRRAYFAGRLRNRMHGFLVRKFMEAARFGLTKAKLARRIQVSPVSITRWLSSPTNLELDTISLLLLGICEEELDPASSGVDTTARNDISSLWDSGPQLSISYDEGTKRPTPADLAHIRRLDWKDSPGHVRVVGNA